MRQAEGVSRPPSQISRTSRYGHAPDHMLFVRFEGSFAVIGEQNAGFAFRKYVETFLAGCRRRWTRC